MRKSKTEEYGSTRHLRVLQQGFMIAYPGAKYPGNPIMFIEGWDSGRAVPIIFDLMDIPNKDCGIYRSVHEIPVKKLNSCFRLNDPEVTIRFELGGSYTIESEWNYPFYGNRIGALVLPITKPNQVSSFAIEAHS